MQRWDIFETWCTPVGCRWKAGSVSLSNSHHWCQGCSLGLETQFPNVSVSSRGNVGRSRSRSRTEYQMSRSRTIGSHLQANMCSIWLHCNTACTSSWMRGVYIVYWFTSLLIYCNASAWDCDVIPIKGDRNCMWTSTQSCQNCFVKHPNIYMFVDEIDSSDSVRFHE